MNKQFLETELWSQPNKESMVKYLGQRNALEVIADIEREITIHFEEDVEYISNGEFDKKDPFPKGLLVSHTMKGGSEGHYVDLTRFAKEGEENICILTVKTFSGVDKANEIANFLTKLYLQDIALTPLENEREVA